MRIKEFRLIDSKSGFEKIVKRGFLITNKGFIKYSYSDNELVEFANVILNGYRILKRDINTITDEEVVVAPNVKMEIIDELCNVTEFQQCLFLSLDDYEIEGYTMFYINLNRNDCKYILKEIEKWKVRFEKCIVRGRINKILSWINKILHLNK